MTASGLAGNLELVSMIACAEEETGEQQLVAQAWRYAVDQLRNPGKISRASWSGCGRERRGCGR